MAAGAASSNATLSEGLTNTVKLANPELANAGPIATLIAASRPGEASSLRRSLRPQAASHGTS